MCILGCCYDFVVHYNDKRIVILLRTEQVGQGLPSYWFIPRVLLRVIALLGGWGSAMASSGLRQETFRQRQTGRGSE